MRQIHAFKCPACGDRDEIDVTALVDVRITDDGTDADLAGDTTHFWEGHSPAQCLACGHAGEVFHFQAEEGDDWIVIPEQTTEGAS